VLARIFKHGSGSGERVLDYLLSEKDHTGALRENPPEVLRGDPETTADLIDSLGFAQRYTSGVLSFTENDAARLASRPEARLELIESFEHDFLAPGMDPDRLAIVWAQHRDGRTEIHFIVANVDLETRKRFPAYYDRADRGRLAVWQDIQNLSRGLDDPRAPERQRIIGHDLKLPTKKVDIAEVLEKFVAQKCMRGELEDRNAIVRFIESRGLKVGRQGKDYITVICGEEKNDRFRLKGAIFHESFRLDRTVATGIERGNAESEADRDRRIKQLRARLESAMQFRREYLERRFGGVSDRAGGRHQDLQQRAEGRSFGGLERVEGSACYLENGGREVDTKAHAGREGGRLSAHNSDARDLRPAGPRDLPLDAQRALESPHFAPDHEGRQELSGDRRPRLEHLQHRGRLSNDENISALQDHRANQSQSVEDHNEHTDNELDALLMDSLQRLSEEFQQRETRLIEQYKSCIASFATQSSTLTLQYNAVSKRLDEVTQHYVDTQALMQRVVRQLNALSEKLR
jgi:hypothetical protein